MIDEDKEKLADLIIVLRRAADPNKEPALGDDRDQHEVKLAAVALESVEALLDWCARGKTLAETTESMREVVRRAEAVGT